MIHPQGLYAMRKQRLNLAPAQNYSIHMFQIYTFSLYKNSCYKINNGSYKDATSSFLNLRKTIPIWGSLEQIRIVSTVGFYLLNREDG